MLVMQLLVIKCISENFAPAVVPSENVRAKYDLCLYVKIGHKIQEVQQLFNR